MDKFEIRSLGNNGCNYDIVVFSKSYDSPFDYLDDLENEIRNLGSNKMTVLFDSLLACGNTSDRFVEARFDDGFDYDSFKVAKIDRSSSLRVYCSKYFSENNEILKFSILPSVQIRMLSQGIVL